MVMTDERSVDRHDGRIDKALAGLLETYNDLNSSYIEELYKDPSPLEFMRYVSSNRPFIIRRGATSWPAYQKWSATYLAKTMSSGSVNVAITPHGNADAIVRESSGRLVYVEPLERQEAFPAALEYIQSATNKRLESGKAVKYLQTQNDNLRTEYAHLFADVPAKIFFASIALDKEPDAVNFWLGNERSVTSLHRDNYENLYAQIRGSKTFDLLPPIASPFVKERTVPVGRYAETEKGLRHVLEVPERRVPVPIWEPDEAAEDQDEENARLTPLKVTLHEGDMFYLPAMWYHRVNQSCGDEGFCCSVNYWYDMEFGGQFWAVNNMLRELCVTVQAHENGVHTKDDEL